VSSGVTAESVEGTARMTLEPSTIGDLQITRASVDADYRNRTAEIRQLEIVGRDLNVSATGRLALNETDQSNLTIHADTPSLEEIGKIVGAPLAGIAKVDATITGNRPELYANGTLVGSGVTYGDNGALSLTTTFDAQVPDLSVERATVDAYTDATFVTVGGQNINQLSATTSYAEQQLEFDAEARQPERTLNATGALALHPEHQEVHLQQLALDTRGQQWRLAPGTETTVGYGGDTISVETLQLASGGQRITAEGAFGRPGDVLHVTLDNIELATVDALLLREPQLTGRLNGSADVTGTRQDPKIEGTFEVAQGAFRQFKYDLPQGNRQLRRRRREPRRAASGDADPVDHRQGLPAGRAVQQRRFQCRDRADRSGVDSSPMNLGVVQGFTNAITDVSGTFQAHLNVGGTAADPQPTGELTLNDGAFSVGAVGVRYTNIAGKIDVQPDRVHIDAITLLDNHFNPLSLSGDLGIGQRRLEALQLYVTADDFKIVDNKLGNVRIESALERSAAPWRRRTSAAISASRPAASTSTKSSRWPDRRRIRPSRSSTRRPSTRPRSRPRRACSVH
jgi:autotransporter translocation and assembly factor TamB